MLSVLSVLAAAPPCVRGMIFNLACSLNDPQLKVVLRSIKLVCTGLTNREIISYSFTYPCASFRAASRCQNSLDLPTRPSLTLKRCSRKAGQGFQGFPNTVGGTAFINFSSV